MNEKESNGKYFGWALTIIFILFGLDNIIDRPIVGLLLIFLGVSFTQIFRTWLKNKTNINTSPQLKQLLYGVFAIIFIIAYINSSAAIKEEKQREEEKKQELIIQEEKQREIIAIKSQTDFFNGHKDDLLNEIKNLQKEKKYSQAIDKANLYIQTQDADLLSLKKETEAVYNEIQKEEAIPNTSNGFDINNETCYMLGMAYGACATRSMNNMECEPGTSFSMPSRCKGKDETKEGIKSGVIIQQSLINKGIYQ